MLVHMNIFVSCNVTSYGMVARYQHITNLAASLYKL
jgi:hypothetical protein